MNAYELNKIVGAVLGSLLLVMVLRLFSEAVFHQPEPAKRGYEVAVAGAPAAPAAGGAAAAVEPIAVRLAKADVAAGQGQFRQCTTCHTPDKGGANRTGPNLWGVVGGAKAHAAGFGYSAGMKERGAKGETWGFEELDKFLENPRGYLAGTSMSFAGIKNPDQRAAVIAYLRSLADTPVPLPKP